MKKGVLFPMLLAILAAIVYAMIVSSAEKKLNDSKNVKGSHKDRHENIGYGTIGFDNLIKVIYNEKLKEVPKILETPYIDGIAPYKKEIEMIRNKKFDNSLK